MFYFNDIIILVCRLTILSWG